MNNIMLNVHSRSVSFDKTEIMYNVDWLDNEYLSWLPVPEVWAPIGVIFIEDEKLNKIIPIPNKVNLMDIVKQNHILNIGKTGSGTTNWLNHMLCNLCRIYRPAQFSFVYTQPFKASYSDVLIRKTPNCALHVNFNDITSIDCEENGDKDKFTLFIEILEKEIVKRQNFYNNTSNVNARKFFLSTGELLNRENYNFSNHTRYTQYLRSGEQQFPYLLIVLDNNFQKNLHIGLHSKHGLWERFTSLRNNIIVNGSRLGIGLLETLQTLDTPYYHELCQLDKRNTSIVFHGYTDSSSKIFDKVLESHYSEVKRDNYRKNRVLYTQLHDLKQGRILEVPAQNITNIIQTISRPSALRYEF